MKITRCKLSKKVQQRLLEFFTAGITARTAADLLNIQPNSAALFYHKIRLVIDHHLSLQADELMS
jgi:transposase